MRKSSSKFFEQARASEDASGPNGLPRILGLYAFGYGT
jgi:hypothetical protein